MVDYPSNEFTRSIEETAEQNRAGGRRMGVASATPQPSVRSADFGKVLDDAPLPPDEVARLDALAREAGIKDERLHNTGDPDTPATYASMEAAVAAGAPVRGHTVAEAEMRVKPVTVVRHVVEPPRFPDFRKVEGIDLVKRVVRVDGFEFPLADNLVSDLRAMVIETARNYIMAQIDAASEEHEEVLEVREGEVKRD